MMNLDCLKNHIVLKHMETLKMLNRREEINNRMKELDAKMMSTKRVMHKGAIHVPVIQPNPQYKA